MAGYHEVRMDTSVAEIMGAHEGRNALHERHRARQSGAVTDSVDDDAFVSQWTVQMGTLWATDVLDEELHAFYAAFIAAYRSAESHVRAITESEQPS